MGLNAENISGNIGINGSLSGNIGSRHISGSTVITRSYDFPVYTGDTTVIPKAIEQVLETNHKTVIDDITVLGIPYTEVSNLSGGLTVNIA